MASVNKVILVGNLGRDPETRYNPEGGAICNISVATTDTWKDKTSGEKQERTEWHRVVSRENRPHRDDAAAPRVANAREDRIRSADQGRRCRRRRARSGSARRGPAQDSARRLGGPLQLR